jgi:hypothetical protein
MTDEELIIYVAELWDTYVPPEEARRLLKEAGVTEKQFDRVIRQPTLKEFNNDQHANIFRS